MNINLKKINPTGVLPLLLLAVAAVYARGLAGGFVIDDRTYFLDNDLLPALVPWDLADIVLHPSNYWGELLPLRDFFYVLQYRLFDENPFGYHAVSLLLYLAVVVVAWVLVHRVSAGDDPASRRVFACGFAVAFFALHPVHVESVAYISGQKDLLCALFSFLALSIALGFLHARPRRVNGYAFGWFTVCYYAAFLSKGLAVATGLVLTLCLLISLVEDRRRWQPLVGGWLLVNILPLCWLAYSSSVAKSVWSGMDSLSTLSLLDRCLRGLRILGEHFLLLAWPSRLNFSYPFDPARGIDTSFWVGLGGVALLVLLFVLVRRFSVRFAVILMLAYLLPVSQLLFDLHNAAIYDRYLFVPVLGAGILLGEFFTWMTKGISLRWPLYGVAGACLLLLALRAFSYVPVFRSDLALTEHAYALFPEWNATSFNLAVSLVEGGEYDRARILLANEPALASPAWVPGYITGWILLEQGQPEKAVGYLQQSFWLAAGGGYFPYAAVPLARAYDRVGNAQQALATLRPVLTSRIVNPVDYYQAKMLQVKIRRRIDGRERAGHEG